MDPDKTIVKAIKKAITGGWKKHGEDVDNIVREAMHECYEPEFSVFDIIFDHDFAKALWGENHVQIKDDDKSALFLYYANDGLPCWQYHLQCMVIADDPIKYLADNI